MMAAGAARGRQGPHEGGRGHKEELKSQRAARLRELQLAAEEVPACKFAVRAAGKQRYSSRDGGHRSAMAACMARLNVVEALRRSQRSAGCRWVAAVEELL
jgi:hypothetical protein